MEIKLRLHYTIKRASVSIATYNTVDLSGPDSEGDVCLETAADRIYMNRDSLDRLIAALHTLRGDADVRPPQAP